MSHSPPDMTPIYTHPGPLQSPSSPPRNASPIPSPWALAIPPPPPPSPPHANLAVHLSASRVFLSGSILEAFLLCMTLFAAKAVTSQCPNGPTKTAQATLLWQVAKPTLFIAMRCRLRWKGMPIMLQSCSSRCSSSCRSRIGCWVRWMIPTSRLRYALLC